MVGVRKALIVATDQYSDPKLTPLNAPANDARALADVLRDEAVGCFEVRSVLNRPSHEVELAIAEFFGAGRFGDTLLAHFSCHGVKSPSGELYFATTDTSLSDAFKLKVTAVSSSLVRDAMEDSRASLILCLVDCCYSGAFVKLTKAAATDDLTERLGGKGRAVITASTSLQLALDGEEEPSLFTHAVIDGLRSGEADRDLDGLVSLDELYSFVHEQVTARNPNQTPVRSFDVQGDVFVARRSTPVTRAAPLDPDLLADARALVPYKRLGAVSGLAAVLGESHPGRSLAARLELSRLADLDDSLSVRKAAGSVLAAADEPPTPTIPDYEPASATRGGPVVEDAPITDDAPGADTATTETETTETTETETTETGTTDTGTTDTGTGGSDERAWWHSPRLKRTGVIALGLVAVLVIAGFVWQALRDDGASGGGGTGPVLGDADILFTVDDPQLGQGILAFDSATGSTRMVIDDQAARLPTISEDRQWMVYQTGELGDPGISHLARVDGSDDSRLLDANASRSCPFTARPAFSPDGGSLAVVCLDSAGDPLALAVVDRDGHLVNTLTDDVDAGGLTWTGDDRIVFMRDVNGDGTMTLWWISVDGGEPGPVTDGLDGSDSHPDWSNRGLLFLRERDDGSSQVLYKESVDAREVTPIPSNGTVDAPTWAPRDRPEVAWLEPAGGDMRTLLVKTLSGETVAEPSTGVYGPPAWGSR